MIKLNRQLEIAVKDRERYKRSNRCVVEDMVSLNYSIKHCII